MKKLIYKIFPVFIFTLLFISCKENLIELNIGKEQNLTTSISTPTAIFGDKIVFGITIDGINDTTLVLQEDVDVTVSVTAKDKNKKDVAPENVFEDFTNVIHMRKGEQRGYLELTIKDNIVDFPINVTLSAYARGYQISPAERTMVISDHYYTVLGLRNNEDKKVSEGTSFVLTASIGTIAKEDFTINIQSDQADRLETESPLPEFLTIRKGFNSVESSPIKVKLQEGENDYENIILNFTLPEGAAYPLQENTLSIQVVDVDANIGDKLTDERNVYKFPEQVFYSEGTAMEVSAWDDVKFTDGKLMKYGDLHPNSTLAGQGWKFLNSFEFHPISSLTAGGKANEWDNRVPKYMAMQAVEGTQKVQAMNNNKYSNMTDEGYLMMWSAYSPGEQVTEGGSGTRDFGVSGFYANKFRGGNSVSDTWESSNVRILPGTRIEARLRVRGEKSTFNAAFWTQGNKDQEDQWSAYGECDILENPARTRDNYTAHQTFHWAKDPNQPKQNDDYNPTWNKSINMTEFNIYWLEWRDNNEIAMGINGRENVTINKNKGAWSNDNHWPFSDTYNTEGMHLLITFAGGNGWALGNQNISDEAAAAELAKTLKNIPYAGSKTNPETPRIEIDWIRFYYKDNYKYKGDGVIKWKNYPMY